VDQPRVPERRGLRRAQPRPAVAAVSGPGAGSTSGSSIPASRRAPAGCCASRICAAPRASTRRVARGARLARAAGERVVSLFCYANRPLPALLDRWPRSRRCCSPRRRGRAQVARCSARPARGACARRRCPAAAADYDALLAPATELRARRGLLRAAQWAASRSSGTSTAGRRRHAAS
jgi:hypothetical protein